MVDINTHNAMTDEERKEWQRISKGWSQWVIKKSGASDIYDLENRYEVGQLSTGKWAIVHKFNGRSTGFESTMRKAVEALLVNAMQNYGR